MSIPKLSLDTMQKRSLNVEATSTGSDCKWNKSAL